MTLPHEPTASPTLATPFAAAAAPAPADVNPQDACCHVEPKHDGAHSQHHLRVACMTLIAACAQTQARTRNLAQQAIHCCKCMVARAACTRLISVIVPHAHDRGVCTLLHGSNVWKIMRQATATSARTQGYCYTATACCSCPPGSKEQQSKLVGSAHQAGEWHTVWWQCHWKAESKVHC